MGHMSKVRALGLMSGTSLDGIDIAYLETNGVDVLRPGPSCTFPYEPDVQDFLRQVLQEAQHIHNPQKLPPLFVKAEDIITDQHEQAVQRFLQRFPHCTPLDIIGFHGQTILHRPFERFTLQLGNGAVLAKNLNVPVVYDFRTSDVKAGGQGAPLVPIFHHALARKLAQFPIAFLNIGGIANLTYCSHADQAPLAFDTGPGNALLNDLMWRRVGKSMDEYGSTAARGKVCPWRLSHLLSHPYFRQPAPKSLDRHTFSLDILSDLSLEDAAATLTAFTVKTILLALAPLPAPKYLLVCGGGVHNVEIMRCLKISVPYPVSPATAFGIETDALEAQAFAYLAVRTQQKLPLTYPSTTGVPYPCPGGTYVIA